tara:strand:+ start:719 stop:2350 length:1632 start_codon:yes stop_codon:yes gene_type:complete
MKIPEIIEQEVEKQDTSKEDMYDASNKEKITLEQAFIEFKENFYQVNQLVLQGSMIKNLMKALKDIQDSQKKDQAQAFKKIQESVDEQSIPKKALENIKTDIRTLYQKILSTKKLMNAAADAAAKGKSNFGFLKKELIDELGQVQEYILEVYNDLASLNPQQVNEQSETLKQMNLDAEKVQAVYNDVLKKVGPIVDVLLKDEKVSEKQLIPVVDEILQRLEKIADLFPSVKTFAGQTGEFAELQDEYIQAIRTMSALNDNFQNIIKDESISSVSARELYRGMQKFSSEIERLFGVPSRIENKPAPKVAMVEPEEAETETTPEDAEEDEQEKEPVELKNMSSVNSWIRNKYLPIEDFLKYFKDNEDIEKSAEKVYDAFLTFIALSKFKEEVNEQDDNRTITPASFSKIINWTSIVFDIPKEDAEEALDIMVKSFRQKAKELQNFYAIAPRKKLGHLAKLIRTRNKQYPFTISDLDKRSFVKNFLKSDDLAQRTGKARGKKRTSGKYDFGKQPATDYPGLPFRENKEQKLSKLLKPLIEKILKEL